MHVALVLMRVAPSQLGSSLIEQLVKWPLTVNVLSIGFQTNVFLSIHKSIIFWSATFTWENNLSAFVHLISDFFSVWIPR